MPYTPEQAERERNASQRLSVHHERMIDGVLSGMPAADGRWYIDHVLVASAADSIRHAYEKAGWVITFEDGAMVFRDPRR